MNKLNSSDKVYVDKSVITGAGRGVFAKYLIRKGELIERCPLIEISKYDMANLNESVLVTYFFNYGNKKEKSAIALGFGSIYNHANKPNALFKINSRDKTIDFIAINHIRPGDEITFNYYGSTKNSDKKNPLWFEV